MDEDGPEQGHLCHIDTFLVYKFIFFFPGKATISNDGATILKTLDIVHPAAKTLVDIAKSQDAEVLCSTSDNIVYFWSSVLPYFFIMS